MLSSTHQFLSKGSAANEVTLSKTEDQGAAITYPEELEEPFRPPTSTRQQWFLHLDYKSVLLSENYFPLNVRILYHSLSVPLSLSLSPLKVFSAVPNSKVHKARSVASTS